MKISIQKVIIAALVACTTVFGAFAAGSLFLGEDATIPYCQPGEPCGLGDGVDLVRDKLDETGDVETEATASEYIQEVVIYLLGFITLVAVIYIIYAGVRILTSSGDEETIKKSKNIIIYVIIGILIIWFAWTIANFAVGLGDAGN